MSKFTLTAKDLEDIAYLSHIDFKIPGEPTDAEPKLVTVVSEQALICIEDLEGHTFGDRWRIIRALKPVKGAPHGGFILEQLEVAPASSAAMNTGPRSRRSRKPPKRPSKISHSPRLTTKFAPRRQESPCSKGTATN